MVENNSKLVAEAFSKQGPSNGRSAAAMTIAPINASSFFLHRPEFIRLPKSPALCPFSGLTRSKMNELVLPCAANDFRPPVKSISLRKRGQTKAVRLVVYDSLMSHLRSFLTDGGAE